MKFRVLIYYDVNPFMYFYASPLSFMFDLHLPLSNESVLAPATSSVPLATTELRIGRRAEILFSCWQLVFDAPVAKFYTLLLSFSFLIATLHILYTIFTLLLYFHLSCISPFFIFCKKYKVMSLHPKTFPLKGGKFYFIQQFQIIFIQT